MLVYDDHLQIVALQTDPVTKLQGQQVINIAFTGSNTGWIIVPAVPRV